ncbi:MAG TPA: isocitrate lyase/PEP mutase family protein [Candidatus Binatia bacterium]|jgi:2-methylisocitrate lyase-like PEP mutase family enzyme|nr:isocitrate lyase/PEP mutase family protein [Candidatus Binatia bacterium]
MSAPAGRRLRDHIARGQILPFIGIYDVFSAAMAARHYDALFVSGFGFGASHYGLPDVGFIAWSDIVAFVQRVRTVLPSHHLLVDIDDGYCDPEVACHVVSLLEAAGASGVVLEDQKRPRQCGHFDGKQIMELDDYIAKLRRVLATRRDMVVVARTDASDPDEVLRRTQAFADAGADAVLADGVTDLALVSEIRRHVRVPVAFNQIAGGKSPPCTLTQLTTLGVSLVIYSTPCLFAAQAGMDDALGALKAGDGLLPAGGIGVPDCTRVLGENLARRAER